MSQVDVESGTLATSEPESRPGGVPLYVWVIAAVAIAIPVGIFWGDGATRLNLLPSLIIRALSALALRDLNLTKIESRPLRGKPWEYMFYLDLIGHRDEEQVKNALRHLGEVADFLRILGSYRAG